MRLQMSQNTENNQSDNLKISSFFSDVHSIEGCSIQIFKNVVVLS